MPRFPHEPQNQPDQSHNDNGQIRRSSFQTSDGFCMSYLHCDSRKLSNGCYDRDCKPIVLLIHDIGYNAKYWSCLIKKLCKVANVYAIDLPGAGQSESTVTANLTLDRISLYATELLDGVCAERVYLVGHGYGALVALNFSIANPERVIKIVAASPNPRPYPLPGSDWTDFMTPEAQVLIAQLIAPDADLEVVACAMTQLFDPIRCEAKEALRNQYISAVNQYILYNPILQDLDFRALASQVTSRVLFTGGTVDPLVPIGALDFLVDEVANSSLVQFNSQGHNYPILNTGLFNTVVFNYFFVKCDPCCEFLDSICLPINETRCVPSLLPCENSDSLSPCPSDCQTPCNNRINIRCRYV